MSLQIVQLTLTVPISIVDTVCFLFNLFISLICFLLIFKVVCLNYLDLSRSFKILTPGYNNFTTRGNQVDVKFILFFGSSPLKNKIVIKEGLK